uniref:Zgc:100997 n=1 Tax=Sinocyclocheilus rhinocerous TaxID=307959 RepID=A0A673ID17_9TELE
LLSLRSDERGSAGERSKQNNGHELECDPPLQVHNLFTDIQDGKILMALLEELSGCNMLDKFRPFPHRIFRLNNISKVLDFLEDRNVSLINIDANDIADGNPSVVLRLIWNIIVYYQIKRVTGSLEKFPSTFSLLSLPCGGGSSGRSSPASPGDDIFGTLPSKGKRSSQNIKYCSTAIKTLLSWAQKCTANVALSLIMQLYFQLLFYFFCLKEKTNKQQRQNSDSASTDSSRGTPNSCERWASNWTDSVSCVLPSNISAEALRGLRHSSETRQDEQTYHTGDQELSSESLPACPSDNPVALVALSEHLWSNGQSLSESNRGQCCDSLAWKKGLMGSLEDNVNCSDVSKEAVYAMSMTVFTPMHYIKLSDGIDDAFVPPVKNGLDKDKIREDLFPAAVKDGLSDNHRYEKNSYVSFCCLLVCFRTGGLDLTSYEVKELHVLLFLWMIAYCILMYPHLDFLSLLNPK